MNRQWIRVAQSSAAAFGILLVLAAPVCAQGDAGKLYKARCASCHGVDGKGNTPVARKLGVRDFSLPEVQKENDQELIDITAKGKNKMPGYASTLKDSQIKDLVSYIRDLAKKK